MSAMLRRLSAIPAFRVAACAALAWAGAARGGDIIWDFGPGTGNYRACSGNDTSNGHVADQVVFSEFVELTGIEMWTCISTPQGDMEIRIHLDNGFQEPGSEFLRWNMQPSRYEFDGNYNGTDLYRVRFDFDPVLLRADTPYWIGVSGNGWQLGHATITAPGDDRHALFRRGEFERIVNSFGDLMFQLRGRAVFPPFEIGLDGACPGPMTANIIGATPGGRIAILGGARGGETIINSGPCRGRAVPLGEAVLIDTITADAGGNASLTFNVPGGCGTIAIAALDLTSCAVTDAARTYAVPELYLGPQIGQPEGLADFNDPTLYRGLLSYDEGGMNFRYVHTTDQGTFGGLTYCGGDGTPGLYMRTGAFDIMGVRRVDGELFDALEFNAGDGFVANCFDYLWIRAYLEGVVVADYTVDMPRWQTVGLVGGEFDEIRVGAYSGPTGRDRAMQDGNERALQAIAIDNVRFGSITPAPSLSVAATCPTGGPIRIEWSGATPNGQVALIFAREEGSFTIPPGNPCEGTRLGLGSNQIRLAWQGPAGPEGARTLNATTGPAPCAGHLQLLDVATCATSNVARIE